ncbi:MAG: DNA-directed RNA polymerase [Alphaproteobacteria bacterium]
MTSQDLLLKLNANDPDLRNQQDILENISRGLSIDQYRKNTQGAIDNKRESGTAYGQSLMMNYVGSISDAIKLIIDKNTDSVGRNNLALKYFQSIEPEALAFIALRGVIDSITKKDTLSNVASKIGRLVELEIQTRVLKEQRAEEYKKAKEKLKKATTTRQRRALIGSIYNRIEINKEGINSTTAIKLGVKLIDIIINTTGLVEIKREISKKTQTNYIVPTEELSQWIQDKNAHCELLSPVYLPCVIPPKDWTSPKKGGYHSKFHKSVPLVKTKGETKRYREMLATHEMPKVYQGINTLQRTKWKINKDVLNVMSECVEKGIDLGKEKVIPPQEDYSEIPCSSCGELVSISKTNNRNTSANHKCFGKDEEGKDTEVTRKWKREAHEMHQNNVALRSRRLSLAKIMWVAGLVKDFPAIYFPYNMDFRGRVYAIPNHLNPQGVDHAKALITFAEGKPIEDPIAGSWLAIQGANTYGNGEDKGTFTERVQFIGGLEDEIRATVEDPINNKSFWTEASKPWQFLAFCFEWVGYLDAERNGESFVSHLPIAQDGSCSGIQHFSAMLKDEEGGSAVNLVPMERPQDIYQKVCEKAQNRFRLEANGYIKGELDDPDAEIIEPNPYAKWLLTLPLDRDMTKTQVMTVPYGLTSRSCTEYTAEYFNDLRKSLGIHKDDWLATDWKVIQYASSVIWDCIGTTVVGAKEAMKWLQDCVDVALDTRDKPIVWDTPMGLPVMQSYRDYKGKKIEIACEKQRTQFVVRDTQEEGVCKKRMKTGIAPNFVHSMDASHLILTVCNSFEEFNITDYAVIHDSFGTHAASSQDLANCLRATFVEMYTDQSILEDFLYKMMSYLVGKECSSDDYAQALAALPKVPDARKLDLYLVSNSKYFFS